MTYLFVRHKVADFETWKKVFDSHAAAQEESGLILDRLLHADGDPPEVIMLFKVTDVDKANAFMNTPEAAEAKDVSGVIGEPDFFYCEG